MFRYETTELWTLISTILNYNARDYVFAMIPMKNVDFFVNWEKEMEFETTYLKQIIYVVLNTFGGTFSNTDIPLPSDLNRQI